MGDFYLQAKKISTVFQLLNTLGTHENDMSRSVAWALGECPEFLNVFVKSVAGVEVEPESTSNVTVDPRRVQGVT